MHMSRPGGDEPKIWVTVLKLIAGLIVIVGGVGLALWYAKDRDNGAQQPPPSDSWGITKDSPVNMRR
jgi:hypothetical protein